MAVPQKINIELSYNPAISLLGMHPKDMKIVLKRYLCTHVHSSIIHNSQEVEAAQVSNKE